MLFPFLPFSLALFTFLAASPVVQAQAPKASTFYIADTETQFSLNVANDSQDLNIFFTSPAYSWVAVGFGRHMKGSLMFVMYPSKNGQNVTISPRIATGYSEPTFAPSISLSLNPDTTVRDDMLVAKFTCRNCRSWAGGSLDTTSSVADMVYAFGDGNRLQSNSQSADLKRHHTFGRFTMDLVAATGPGGVPENRTMSVGTREVGGMKTDHDRAKVAHAVIGCLALFGLWPLNLIVRGFVKRVGLHVGVSAVVLVFLIVSYALGISVSGEFNRSKSFSSPHQILAFLSIPTVLLTTVLPLPSLQHIPLIERISSPTAFLTFVLLVITGGLGLQLASSPTPIVLVYTALSLFVLLSLLILQTLIWKCGGPRSQKARRGTRGAEDDEQDLVLAAYYAGRDLKETESRAGAYTPNSQRSGYSGNGANGGGSPPRNLYGGGTMPGPQYLLNMHPGVPVHRFEMVDERR